MRYITAPMLLFFVLGLLIPNAFAENVPDWVKTTAGWWADGIIDDNSFVSGIEYLVKEDIIRVDVLQTTETSQAVPEWVKNTAGWWATDIISELEFVNAIAYLIKIGIINIESSKSPELIAEMWVGDYITNEITLETKSKSYDNMDIAIQIKIPSALNDINDKIIEINTIDKNTEQRLENITYFIKISKNGQDILREYFFSEDETLVINLSPNQNTEIEVNGYRNYEHNALNDDFDDNIPITIKGPLFTSQEEYNFTIDILTINDPKNWIFSLTDFNAQLSFTKNDNQNETTIADTKIENKKIQTYKYDSIKFVSIIESDDAEKIFDDVLKKYALEWMTEKITDTEFMTSVKTHPEFKSLYANPDIQGQLPEWLLNNAGRIAATILTNGEMPITHNQYVEETIYPCNEKIVQNPNFECWDIEINSQGFRSDEIDENKSDEVFRIITLGGSTTYGGISNEKTWSGHLQRIIEEYIPDKKIEVINAGKMGATTNYELEFVKNKLLLLDPDLIIMYDGWNDSQNEKIEKTIQNWKDVCQISKDNDIATAIIIQPLPVSGQRVLTDQEIKSVLNPSLSSPHEYQRISQQYVDSLNELNEICTLTLDFRGIFDYIHAPIYWDGGHVLNHGNIILASNIFTSIAPEFFEKSFIIKHNYFSDEFQSPILYAVKTDLQNMDMNGLFLKDAIFDKAKLKNANFINADLTNSRFVFANLPGANLSGANLSGANLSGANLFGATLSCTTLSCTNLSGANLSGANLSGANLSGANLSGVNLSGIYSKAGVLLQPGVNISNANLSGVNISGANLSGVNLSGVNLSGVNLSGVDLFGRNLSNANLSGANLSSHDLSGAFFIGSTLTGTIFEGIDMSPKQIYSSVFNDKAYLIQDNGQLVIDTELDFLSFRGFDVYARVVSIEVSGNDLVIDYFLFNNFSHANLENANFKDTILAHANFDHADLTNADFTNANLSKVLLTNANLTNAIFHGANLSEANLSGANLSDVFIDENTNLNCKNHPICLND